MWCVSLPPHYRQRVSSVRISTFDEDLYEERSVILGSKVKAALEVLGRNESPQVDGTPTKSFQTTEAESVKMRTRIYQQIW